MIKERVNEIKERVNEVDDKSKEIIHCEKVRKNVIKKKHRALRIYRIIP